MRKNVSLSIVCCVISGLLLCSCNPNEARYETVPFSEVSSEESVNVLEATDNSTIEEDAALSVTISYNEITHCYEGTFSNEDMDVTYNVSNFSEGRTPSKVNLYDATILAQSERMRIDSEYNDIMLDLFDPVTERECDVQYYPILAPGFSELFFEEWQTRYGSVHSEDAAVASEVIGLLDERINEELADYAVVYDYVPGCYNLRPAQGDDITSDLWIETPDSLEGLWHRSYCLRFAVDGIPIGTPNWTVFSNSEYNEPLRPDGIQGSFWLNMSGCCGEGLYNGVRVSLFPSYISDIQVTECDLDVIPLGDLLGNTIQPLSLSYDHGRSEYAPHMTITVYGAELIYVRRYQDYHGFSLPAEESQCELTPAWVIYFVRGTMDEMCLRSEVVINAVTGEVMNPVPF